MATRKVVAKKVGSPNRDPVTGALGFHPVGVGVGTAVGGAAAGMAAGAAAGPVGAVAGAVIGGIVGGLAGDAAAEAIDPTVEDAYWKKEYKSRDYVAKGQKYDELRPAYRYGWESSAAHAGKSWDEVKSSLSRGWRKARGESAMTWEQAMPAVRDAFDRTVQIREERLNVRKEPVETGEVRVRKEVVKETKHLDVPVEREEVVIERRPARGRKAAADIRAEEIRIPVKKEKVRVEKTPVVTEEVTVGKRKVRDTHHVSGTVRKERLKVDQQGDVAVRNKTTGR